MVRRLLALVLLTPFLALVGLTTPAHADPDPVPPLYQSWPWCGDAPDTDGRYCLVSVTENGVEVPRIDYTTPGTYAYPYVDLLDPGTVRFGLGEYVIADDHSGSYVWDLSPDNTWTFVVNVGSIQPNELYGHIRDTELSFGGDTSSGNTFTLTFKPTPIAWRWDTSPGGGMLPCSYDSGCGDDTTVAGLVYGGFVTGYVSDDATWSEADRVARHGYVYSTNAQDAYPYYDDATNTLEIRMANPHLQAPGVPATGFYDTFLPDSYLTTELSVPDPSTLSAGDVTVVRAGSSTSVPFTLTQEPGGVRIHIAGITFSTPKYKIHPNASPPGTPRWGAVQRISLHQVRVRFRAPVADGGKEVTSYRARCRTGTGPWHYGVRSTSPIVVGRVRPHDVSCQVRARNVIGSGAWSTSRHE